MKNKYRKNTPIRNKRKSNRYKTRNNKRKSGGYNYKYVYEDGRSNYSNLLKDGVTVRTPYIKFKYLLDSLDKSYKETKYEKLIEFLEFWTTGIGKNPKGYSNPSYHESINIVIRNNKKYLKNKKAKKSSLLDESSDKKSEHSKIDLDELFKDIKGNEELIRNLKKIINDSLDCKYKEQLGGDFLKELFLESKDILLDGKDKSKKSFKKGKDISKKSFKRGKESLRNTQRIIKRNVEYITKSQIEQIKLDVIKMLEDISDKKDDDVFFDTKFYMPIRWAHISFKDYDNYKRLNDNINSHFSYVLSKLNYYKKLNLQEKTPKEPTLPIRDNLPVSRNATNVPSGESPQETDEPSEEEIMNKKKEEEKKAEEEKHNSEIIRIRNDNSRNIRQTENSIKMLESDNKNYEREISELQKKKKKPPGNEFLSADIVEENTKIDNQITLLEKKIKSNLENISSKKEKINDLTNLIDQLNKVDFIMNDKKDIDTVEIKDEKEKNRRKFWNKNEYLLCDNTNKKLYDVTEFEEYHKLKLPEETDDIEKLFKDKGVIMIRRDDKDFKRYLQDYVIKDKDKECKDKFDDKCFQENFCKSVPEENQFKKENFNEYEDNSTESVTSTTTPTATSSNVSLLPLPSEYTTVPKPPEILLKSEEWRKDPNLFQKDQAFNLANLYAPPKGDRKASKELLRKRGGRKKTKRKTRKTSKRITGKTIKKTIKRKRKSRKRTMKKR